MKDIFYGPVIINTGPLKGCIGYCDNDDTRDDGVEVGIVYIGHPMLVDDYHLIKWEDMSHVTTHNLIERKNNIENKLTPYSKNPLRGKSRVSSLEELLLINDQLSDRMFTARLTENESKSNIFISYSSKDKQFAMWISVDLKNAGYNIWLDEWEISVGESIPKKIETGVGGCDFLILVLSENSVQSNWVECEWHIKYWDEVEKGSVYVLPALKETCTIPGLLKTKRYADFTVEYSQGLEDLLISINKLKKSKISAKQ